MRPAQIDGSYPRTLQLARIPADLILSGLWVQGASVKLRTSFRIMRDTSIAEAAIRSAAAAKRSELLSLFERRSAGRLDPEELVQIAVARAIEHADQLRDPNRAEAWIGRIARNVLIDELRRRHVPVTPIDELELASLDPDDIDCWCVLVQAEQLKPEYAQILRRVVLDGRPVKEVAEELGLTANNAMVRLHRAREALKARMLAHCGTTSARSCSECGCEERGCCPKP